jgi:thiol-disulfide isomerase/thioredoxin
MMNDMKHMFKVTAFVAVILLIGAGCPLKPAPTLELPSAPPPSIAEPRAESDGATAPEASPERARESRDLSPYYIAYSPEAVAAARKEGRPIVYYFWAVWCPICKAEEPKIKSWIENSGLPVAGFRVNFDTQSDLKSQYKVPYQHTTIFFDKNGVEVDRNFGPVTEAEFLDDLKRAAR